MYKKEKAKHKEEKTYVVNRNFKSSGNLKAGRNVKMVDTRMKKDMRNSKYKSKGKRGGGTGPKKSSAGNGSGKGSKRSSGVGGGKR